ncbi:hypothetical protein [Chitinophaga sp. 212800010-3]|uniref:hypothetical protein n=1 Tax=unclassified Chitinophaga TaxID=2619133 RepID=UPI002DF0DDC3|nr:DUF4968 domain-containing protein [Chitinophaga sp. 212800010-3]
MKKHISLPVLLLCLLITCYHPLTAQKNTPAKEDSVIMLTGEIKHGRVTAVSTDAISFVHSNESLEYSLKKTDIQKIVFASGRTEVITVPTAIKFDNYPPMERNLIAILPFKYRSVGEAWEDIGATKEKLQDDAYTYLSRHNGQYKYQDPQTTNALLMRNGIDENNIKAYTFDELCKILGTEYIVQGSLSRSSKDNISSAETKTIKKDDDRINQNKASNTVVEKTYQNEVTILIYNWQNSKIFGTRRTALLDNESSYKDALLFILKRCPVYNR